MCDEFDSSPSIAPSCGMCVCVWFDDIWCGVVGANKMIVNIDTHIIWSFQIWRHPDCWAPTWRLDWGDHQRQPWEGVPGFITHFSWGVHQKNGSKIPGQYLQITHQKISKDWIPIDPCFLAGINQGITENHRGKHMEKHDCFIDFMSWASPFSLIFCMILM